MREDLSVLRELEVTLDEAVHELAGFHAERADVASNLFGVLGESPTENRLEDA